MQDPINGNRGVDGGTEGQPPLDTLGNLARSETSDMTEMEDRAGSFSIRRTNHYTEGNWNIQASVRVVIRKKGGKKPISDSIKLVMVSQLNVKDDDDDFFVEDRLDCPFIQAADRVQRVGNLVQEDEQAQANRRANITINMQQSPPSLPSNQPGDRNEEQPSNRVKKGSQAQLADDTIRNEPEDMEIEPPRPIEISRGRSLAKEPVQIGIQREEDIDIDSLHLEQVEQSETGQLSKTDSQIAQSSTDQPAGRNDANEKNQEGVNLKSISTDTSQNHEQNFVSPLPVQTELVRQSPKESDQTTKKEQGALAQSSIQPADRKYENQHTEEKEETKTKHPVNENDVYQKDHRKRFSYCLKEIVNPVRKQSLKKPVKVIPVPIMHDKEDHSTLRPQYPVELELSRREESSVVQSTSKQGNESNQESRDLKTPSAGSPLTDNNQTQSEDEEEEELILRPPKRSLINPAPSTHSQSTDIRGTSTLPSPTRILKRRAALPHPTANLLKRSAKEKKEKPSPAIQNPSGVVCCNSTDLKYNVANEYCSYGCRIHPGDTYKISRSGTFFCLECFSDDYSDTKRCIEKVHENQMWEEILECGNCRKKYHKCCSFHLDASSDTFICESCRGLEIQKTVDRIPKKACDEFMTENLNGYMQSIVGNGNPFRQISTISFTSSVTKKTGELSPKSCSPEFKKKYGAEITYREQVIYIFQRIDGIDVLVFVMYTQHYQNHNRKNLIVIDYLDSVPYFEPENHRGYFFGKIIITYLKYTKSIGYTNAHIWVSAPSPQDNFIFNIHPADQIFLEQDALEGFYKKKVLDQGKEDEVIVEWRTFQEEYTGNKNDIINLPFVANGLWTRTMKELAKEMYGAKKATFLDEVVLKFQEHQSDNFYIDFFKAEDFPNDLSVRFEDPLNPHAVMGNREDFLSKCRKENWEFGSDRRAKYSSVALINMIMKDLDLQ